jgi:hypothetical protein
MAGSSHDNFAPGKPLRIVGGLIGIAVILAAIYWNTAFITKAHHIRTLVDATKKMTAQEFLQNSDALLSSHKDIGNEDAVSAILQPVLLYAGHPQKDQGNDAHDLLDMLAHHASDTKARNLLSLGEGYAALWAEYYRDSDYSVALDYFNRVQELKPNEPESMSCLYYMYVIKNNMAKAIPLGKQIEKNWGVPPEQLNACPIFDVSPNTVQLNATS